MTALRVLLVLPASISHSCFEDLVEMPGNMDHVHLWLLWPGDEQGLTGECIHRYADLVPGYI